MRARNRARTVLAATAVAALAASGSAVAATGGGGGRSAGTGTGVTVTPYLSGLNAPRGITFDGTGHLYVAESGVAGPDDHGLTTSGRVRRYDRGSMTPFWSASFSSLYVHEAPPPAPADVLGPEGMSAQVQGCGRHRTLPLRACQPRMVMSESTKGTGVHDAQVGRLFRLNRGNGRAVTVSNVGDQQWTWTKNHPNVAEPLPDSNPYAVLVSRYGHRVRTFVVDAGANTVSEVTRTGRTRVIALIPNDTPAHDSAPTCVTRGPDGWLYVGTLDLVVNNFGATPGHSNVWRVNPNAHYPAKPRLWASGLTTVTACAFDHKGTFWGAEMFYPNPAGAPGDLVRIPFAHPGRLTHVGGGQVPLPGGIAVARDNSLYVTTNSAAPGPAGAVVRVTNP